MIFESPTPSLAACPRCGTGLAVDGNQISCTGCGSDWKIRNGIPRFFDPVYYWGEVPLGEAQSLQSDAQKHGWRQAVEKHFENDRVMAYSILQWQSRASWLPLLGLSEDATALDIGSGYGAITHALARAAKEVYSVEAIPERVEFTSIRLQQEGLTNVRLIQGSATELPLRENVFDLIVVNGVLEWVGEWDLGAPPQDVQLRFLRKVHRMLKPGGVCLLGIENRIGYGNFRGALDHSGLPYTSLMPRWLSSLVLRYSQRAHHRTRLNAKREYRTYTYSELGYRRILGKSGFGAVSFYLADPGYNRPLSLVPLQRNALAAHTLRVASEPILGSRPRWPRLVKLYLSRLGLLRPFVPEFVIIASKDVPDATRKTAGWRRAGAVPPGGMHLDEPSQYLSIGPAGTKAVIRIFGSGDSAPSVIAKASPSNAKADESLISAFRVLSSLQPRLSEERELPFSTPTPVESFSQAGWHFTVETAVPGRPLSELIFLRSHRGRLAFLRNELAQCVEIAAKLPHILKGTVAAHKIDPEWYEIPKGMDLGPGVERTLAAESAKWAKEELCAHGDFTIENVFWDKDAEKASVIDWELPIQGVPPLYDAFTLLFSSLPALDLEHRIISSTDERLTQQFQAAFFSTGPWATTNREILQRISTTPSGADSDIWQELVLSLVIRTRYFLWRQPSLGRQYSRLLEYAVQHEPLFVCGAHRSRRSTPSSRS